MAGIRALQKRMPKLEDAGKPRPSPTAVWYGSFTWVEQAVLPGVESGTLASEDMIDVVTALRGWEALYAR